MLRQKLISLTKKGLLSLFLGALTYRCFILFQLIGDCFGVNIRINRIVFVFSGNIIGLLIIQM